MAEMQPENSADSQAQADSGSTSVGSLNVGGNVGGNVTTGNNNVVTNITNNFYQEVVEKNTEKHEPEYWALKHPYPMPPNFTGRIAERALLTHWLKEDSENRLFILRALGGFGKSALAWQWLTHDVDIKEYPKVLWWSFYEGDASFEHFTEETLKYLKLEVPQGQRPQVDELLNAMQSQKILLIMDGFERALRAYSSMNAAYQGDESPLPEGEGQGEGAYDCVNINAEIFLKSICSLPNIKSKVLMTTRLTPRVVRQHGELILGCREEKLEAMQKEDAVEFFHKQKIKGTHAEIEAACAPYGYHPLSLRLLAGRILKDFENPADILVAQKIKIDGDIIQQKHHVLEVSYNSLPPHEQKLLSTIACFRSPVELKTLEAIEVRADGRPPLQDDLHDLIARGLLHFDNKNKKFDLHPIVRRFAYDYLTTPDRTDVHKQLVNYFDAIPRPEKVEKLEDLASVIELYHHMVKTGQFDTAYDLIYERSDTIYYQFGASQTYAELISALFPSGEGKLPQLKEKIDKARILNDLALVYSVSGQPHRAIQLFEQSNKLFEKDNNKTYATGLANMAIIAQLPIGALYSVEKNLQRSIKIDQKIESEYDEACDRLELGRLLTYCGAWVKAKQELEMAQNSLDIHGTSSFVSVVRGYRAQHILQATRDLAQPKTENYSLAIQLAQEALELAAEFASKGAPVEYDFLRAHWLLGVAYRHDNQFELSEHHLSEALTRDRLVNMVLFEADILIDLARLRYDQKNYEEAKSLAEEALLITERCGYVLQGADVNLFLAQYALEQEKDKAKAKEHAETALKLAYCDGPPYYYKVAYHEAERFLENLK